MEKEELLLHRLVVHTSTLPPPPQALAPQRAPTKRKSRANERMEGQAWSATPSRSVQGQVFGHWNGEYEEGLLGGNV